MKEGADEGRLFSDLVTVDGGVALAGGEDCQAILVIERDEGRREVPTVL